MYRAWLKRTKEERMGLNDKRGGAKGRGIGVEIGERGGIGIGFGIGSVIRLGLGMVLGRRQGACQTTSP